MCIKMAPDVTVDCIKLCCMLTADHAAISMFPQCAAVTCIETAPAVAAKRLLQLRYWAVHAAEHADDQTSLC